MSVEYPRRGYNGFFEWFTCGKAGSETVAWEGLALTWCRIHSIRRTIVFIVFLFPDVMKFYCDVYCVCLLQQVRAEGLWMAIDLISVFLKQNPFLRHFLTNLGFSISSLLLNTMLFWCQTLLHYYISVRSHDRYNSWFIPT